MNTLFFNSSQYGVKQEIAASADQQVAGLTRRLKALGLLSRSLREIPIAHLETLAGELLQRIEKLR